LRGLHQIELPLLFIVLQHEQHESVGEPLPVYFPEQNRRIGGPVWRSGLVEIQRAVVALGGVTIMLKLLREGAVGFIEWLDGFIDMQAHVLNAFATAVSNDNIR
jgi:hypothetical protein